MNRFFLNIVAITILILYNNPFCQSKPIKQIMTNNSEVKVVRGKPKKASKIITPKPINRDEVIHSKPKRKINHQNPPQRPQKQTNPSIKVRPRKQVNPSRTIGSYKQSADAHFPRQRYQCRSGSFRVDIIEDEFEIFDENEISLEYKKQQENYCLNTKFFGNKEFTDEDFPISINKIEFKYLQNQWIDSNDFPEYLIDKESGEYLIYSIKFDAYIIEQSYDYPFAVLITFPDYSSEIAIFNYNSEYLEADSIYFFEGELPLERTGYAWLTLGYYDFEYNKFYSAALSPYLTKQKIYIPDYFVKHYQVEKEESL